MKKIKKNMATVNLTYKDDQGVLKTVEADLTGTIRIEGVGAEEAYDIIITDTTSKTVVTEYVGPAPKRN